MVQLFWAALVLFFPSGVVALAVVGGPPTVAEQRGDGWMEDFRMVSTAPPLSTQQLLAPAKEEVREQLLEARPPGAEEEEEVLSTASKKKLVSASVVGGGAESIFAEVGAIPRLWGGGERAQSDPGLWRSSDTSPGSIFAELAPNSEALAQSDPGEVSESAPPPPVPKYSEMKKWKYWRGEVVG